VIVKPLVTYCRIREVIEISPPSDEVARSERGDLDSFVFGARSRENPPRWVLTFGNVPQGALEAVRLSRLAKLSKESSRPNEVLVESERFSRPRDDHDSLPPFHRVHAAQRLKPVARVSASDWAELLEQLPERLCSVEPF